MPGYPEQMAISQECWITYAEILLHYCPHVADLCADVQCVWPAGMCHICSADPWAAQQPPVTPMPLDPLALAGPSSFAWPEDALALLSASAFLQHRSVLSCRYFHPGFTNSTFIFLSFLGKYFPYFSAGPTAKNTSSVNKVKASVSAPFLSDYLHSYLEGICGTEVLTHNLVIQFPEKLPPSK